MKTKINCHCSDMDSEFQECFNTIVEAARKEAFRVSSASPEFEKIFFSIGYVRNHLKFNGLLPKEQERFTL